MRREWMALATVLAVGLLLGVPSVTRGEDAQAKEEFPDRFMIRGGWAYVFNADTTFNINGAGGIGSSVDFARTLGGQRTDNLWRIDSLYRFNPRHSVGFSYYDVTRKGDRTLDLDITIDGITYAAGGTVNSEIDIGLYRFFYNYSFHRDEKVELALSLGLYFADISASFSSNVTCTATTGSCPGVTSPGGSASTLLAPLPSIGVFANYWITPRLMSTARFDWFYVETAQFKGDMSEVFLGLEYRLFKNFAVGGAFNRLDVDLDYDPDRSDGWRLENDWNTLLFYGALYF